MKRFADQDISGIFRASKGERVSSSTTTTYKEIQIHGPIEFSRDIEMIGIDAQELKNEKSLDSILTFIKLYGVKYEVV